MSINIIFQTRDVKIYFHKHENRPGGSVQCSLSPQLYEGGGKKAKSPPSSHSWHLSFKTYEKMFWGTPKVCLSFSTDGWAPGGMRGPVQKGEPWGCPPCPWQGFQAILVGGMRMGGLAV